ncbi:MAG: hypothetical protein A2Z72_00710 [Omnitrophica bacterium RBG_13_46_9]|nr:MAG: hypothetical protein A2Z72_00710 [Omnitrophica bacterium RBG_13_46_9]
MDEKWILIIDDEENFCEMIKMNLEASGKYKALTAYSGEEGIAMAKSTKPDIILLDISMPKMDGFEVLKALKAHAVTSSIPVIMLSALDDDSSKMRASEMYSEHYFTKPATTEELIAKIERVLELRGRQR